MGPLTDGQTLWAVARASGFVAQVLLTAVVALGAVSADRRTPGWWPRSMGQALHRTLTASAFVVLALHAATVVADSYVDIRVVDVLVPFIGHYRAVWLGLGTLALDALVVLAVTSILRRGLPPRAWRLLHAAAWPTWAAAIVHGLGTGYDARRGWVQLLTLACVGVVLLAALVRVSAAPSRPWLRWAAGGLVAAATATGAAWAHQGPLRPGWSHRAEAGLSGVLPASETKAGRAAGVPTPAGRRGR